MLKLGRYWPWKTISSHLKSASGVLPSSHAYTLEISPFSSVFPSPPPPPSPSKMGKEDIHVSEKHHPRKRAASHLHKKKWSARWESSSRLKQRSSLFHKKIQTDLRLGHLLVASSFKCQSIYMHVFFYSHANKTSWHLIIREAQICSLLEKSRLLQFPKTVSAAVEAINSGVLKVNIRESI